MKKKLIIIAIIMVLSILKCEILLAETGNNIIKNTQVKINDIDVQEEIDSLVYDISSQGLNKTILSESISKYKELSENYTNEEIIEMIDKSVDAFGRENINSKTIENINKLLSNYESEDLIKIIDTIDIDKAISELSEGATIFDLVKITANNMSTEKKAELFASFIFSSKIMHTILILLLIIIIYKLFTRCVIYKKAGEHAWAVLVPIYRDIVMLRICGMSPWWLLLLLVPVIGWFILWLVHVASRFMLAEGFNKSELFGLGLWLLWPIFEAVLVFSKKIKYIGFEEN